MVSILKPGIDEVGRIEMKLRFVVSHPFRKEREMDGAPRVCGLMSERQLQVLRLAALAQDDSLFEDDRVVVSWVTVSC